MRRKTQQKSGRGFWRAVALGVVAGAAAGLLRPGGNRRGDTGGGCLCALGGAWQQLRGGGVLVGLGVGCRERVGPAEWVVRQFDAVSDVGRGVVVEWPLGSNGWVVTAATLVVNEVGAPNNAIFNRGVGGFEIRWIGADAWAEGTGTPNTPTTDGVAYQDLASVLNPAADASVGRFTNSGVSGPVSFPLMLAGALVSNIVAGTDLNLYLTAASASVGFTFNSRHFATSNAWPSLTITAVAKPLVRITSIERLGTNQVAIRFNTVSNWSYAVQGLDGLPAGWAGAWSNLFTVPARPFDDQGVFVDTVTNRQRFYRLLLWQ